MNDILILAFEYMKIGAVAIGGGYTVIPFLYYLVDKYKWFEVAQITQMIAVSNLTPGPIGINMATFVGVKVGGILGAAFVTFAFMVPSFIIVCSLSKFLGKDPTTSANPPVLINGTDSEAANNIFFMTFPPLIFIALSFYYTECSPKGQ